MPNGLNRICMEIYSFFPAYSSDLLYRLYCSYLVIGRHYAYKYSVRSYCFLYVIGAYHSIFIDRNICHLIAVFLKELTGMEYGMVLYICCYYMFSLVLQGKRHSLYGPVIAFRATACKKYLTTVGVYGVSHLLSGEVNRFLAFPGELVDA